MAAVVGCCWSVAAAMMDGPVPRAVTDGKSTGVDTGRVGGCVSHLLIELVFILISFSVIPRYDSWVWH